MAIHLMFYKNHIVYVWVQYCISYTVNITVYNIFIYIWRRLLDDLLATFSLSTHFSLLCGCGLSGVNTFCKFSWYIAYISSVLYCKCNFYCINVYNVSFFFSFSVFLYIEQKHLFRKLLCHFSLQSGIFLIMIHLSHNKNILKILINKNMSYAKLTNLIKKGILVKKHIYHEKRYFLLQKNIFLIKKKISHKIHIGVFLPYKSYP